MIDVNQAAGEPEFGIGHVYGVPHDNDILGVWEEPWQRGWNEAIVGEIILCLSESWPISDDIWHAVHQHNVRPIKL